MLDSRLADLLSEIAALSARQAALTAELARVLRDASAAAATPAAAAALPEYLTTRAAAAMLGVSERTLKSLRAEQRGPAFVRIGRAVRYPSDALIDCAPR